MNKVRNVKQVRTVIECPECGGQGYSIEYYGGYSDFYGSPNERETRCLWCAGAGKVEESYLVNVTPLIPVSVDHDERAARFGAKVQKDFNLSNVDFVERFDDPDSRLP